MEINAENEEFKQAVYKLMHKEPDRFQKIIEEILMDHNFGKMIEEAVANGENASAEEILQALGRNEN